MGFKAKASQGLIQGTAVDISSELFLRRTRISEVINKKYFALDKQESAKSSLSRMLDNNSSCVIIEDSKIPVGVLTGKDISRLILDGQDIASLKNMDVMSHPVVTIGNDSTDIDALRVMNDNCIKRLVVVDGSNRIMGTVTSSYIKRRLETVNVQALKNAVLDREKAKQEAEEALDHVAIYFDNILRSFDGTAIIAADLGFRVKYYNPAAEKIFGIKAGNVIGKTVMDIHALKNVDGPRFNKAINYLHEIGSYNFSFDLVTETGTKYYSNRISFIKNHKGENLGYVCFAHDITDRLQMENALLAEGRAYRTLFEDSPVSLWELNCSMLATNVKKLHASSISDISSYFDESTDLLMAQIDNINVVDINKAAMALHEAGSKEEFMKGLGDFCREGNRDALKHAVIAIYEGKRKFEIETEMTTLKGRNRKIILKWAVAPGYETTYSKVLLSIVDVTEQKMVEKKLRQAIDENDILLKEVHHRVKNNLQVVCSLFNLQKSSIKDKEAADMIGECQNRIRAIALVHDKLYHSKSLVDINMREYIEDLIINMKNFYEVNPNKFLLEAHVDDIRTGVDIAIPCGLVINEMASVFLQRTILMNKGGRISINVGWESENNIDIKIKGVGVALAEDYGILNESNLSLHLISALTKQLNGKLEIINESDGTLFNLKFKLKNE